LNEGPLVTWFVLAAPIGLNQLSLINASGAFVDSLGFSTLTEDVASWGVARGIARNLGASPVFLPDCPPGNVSAAPGCSLGPNLTAEQIAVMQSSRFVTEISSVPLPAGVWGLLAALTALVTLGRRKRPPLQG
ncbi:MAG: VPLPA-CTERM sorting domain-containing protein, partial [Pseudomonadota bacterium]